MDAIVGWLLEPESPSVRFLALRSLLGRPEGDPEALEAKGSIMLYGPVHDMFEKQNEDGSWGDVDRFYTDKYKGTSWDLLMLAELGADSNDARVKRTCEFILDRSQDRGSGGFSFRSSAKDGGGLPSGVIPCLTGNMAFSLVRLGFLDDPRVQSAIDWIVRYQRTDDADGIGPEGPMYDRYKMCWGSHSCHMGVAKAFKALAAIPREARSPQVRDKLAELAEYFLRHRVFRKSHDLGQVSRPGWLKFGFPLMYQTDVLELVSIFASLGIRDSRLDDAITVIRDRQEADGAWKLESSFNDRTLVRIDRKGCPSKWVTLRASEVMRFYS